MCVGHCSQTHGIVLFDESGVGPKESHDMKCTCCILGQRVRLNYLIQQYHGNVCVSVFNC